jgi:hypothetical protein
MRPRDGCGGLVLDLNSLDLEEIANALADQTGYEHRHLINRETGEVVFWTPDTGIDCRTPVDLDEPDLICIDPLPSHVCHQETTDFAGRVGDEQAGRGPSHPGRRRLPPVQRRAARGVRAPARYAFRDTRAVEWLVDNSLIDNDAATRYRGEHPEPDVP